MTLNWALGRGGSEGSWGCACTPCQTPRQSEEVIPRKTRVSFFPNDDDEDFVHGYDEDHVRAQIQLMDRPALEEAFVEQTRAAHLGGQGFLEGAQQTRAGSLKGMWAKINHVTHIVEDAERSREFYEEILGATRLNRPNFPSPGYWLWLGNVQLHLIQGAHAKLEAMHAEGVPTGNVNHISFEVYDFDAVEMRLREMGINFKKNRVPEQGVVIHQIFMQDPDGHYIEICDCNQFSNFVFGLDKSEGKADELAQNYMEGVDPMGASVAAAAAIAFVHGKTWSTDNGDEDDFHECLGMLQRAFKTFAGDDNFVEGHELKTMLARMGHSISDREIEDMMRTLDGDGDGRMGFKEFVRFMIPKLKPDHSIEELRSAFALIDKDGSGTVTPDELLLMLWGIGERADEDQLAEAIRNCDKDGDGAVNFEEFVQLFKSFQSIDRSTKFIQRINTGRLSLRSECPDSPKPGSVTPRTPDTRLPGQMLPRAISNGSTPREQSPRSDRRSVREMEF